MKRKAKAFLLVAIIFISGFIAIWFVNSSNPAASSDGGAINDFSQLSSSSAPTYAMVGSGDNQTVRVYLENQSTSLNNQGSFDVSAPNDHSYLTYGDFNFTFQHNYTTDYVLEDDNALNLDKYQKFKFNSDESSMEEDGSPLSQSVIDDLTDGDTVTTGKSFGSGLGPYEINLTLNANFSNQDSLDSSLTFNRSKILGYQYNLSLEVQRDIKLSVFAKNITNGWYNVSFISIESSDSLQQIKGTFINSNLNYSNLSNITDVSFLFESDGTYTIDLFELELNAIQGFELPITDNENIALEFDLKGDNSTINGISTWIRTLNTTKAKNQNAQLTFTLYYSNTTIPRTQTELDRKSIEPNSGTVIDQATLNGYTGDGMKYIPFNTDNTNDLPLSNYFVVISSDLSDPIYSIVGIPQSGEYGDDNIEQIVLSGSVSSTWTYEDFDASDFKVNVTRGYMPSDFETDGFNNLTIDNIPLENRIIENIDKSNEEWGLGQWTHNFTNYISSFPSSNFQVPLEWNKSITSGFEFNVSNYFVRAYSAENATARYEVNYEGITETTNPPQWILNYTFDSGNSMFTNWDFTEFWFTYENYHTAEELFNPDSTEILGQTGGETEIKNDSRLKKIILSNSTLTIDDGVYSLHLTSFNALPDTNIYSYIQYKEYFWESTGFMHGDNMTIGAEVRGPTSIAPTSGTINATLFYPDGTPYLTDIEITGERTADKSILLYEFGNETLLQIDKSIPEYGKYYLGMFWENGSLIGCNGIPIYIDSYNIEFGNLTYLPSSNKNQLEVKNISLVGEPDTRNFYNLYLASVNKSTQFPLNYYSINNSGLAQQFKYEQEIPIKMDAFLQNESILNPGEPIRFKVSLENLDDRFDVDAKVSIKLISAENEEWIINSGDSLTKSLKQQGTGKSSKDFDVSFNIPSLDENGVWYGQNAPIRNGAAKAVATIYIEGEEVWTYESLDLALLINKTEDEFEGSIISMQTSKTPSPADLKEFDREDLVYSPDIIQIIGNIVDETSVSTYRFFNQSYLMKMRSQFQNIEITPTTPNRGIPFNISSTLSTEFGSVLGNKDVLYQYYNGTEWVNITSNPITSDENGFTNIQVNPQDLVIQNNKALIRLQWEGSEHILNGSSIFNVSFAEYTAQLSIKANIIGTDIYRNTDAFLRAELTNTGNSRLNITDITLSFDNSNPSYEIIQKESLVLQNLGLGESTIVKFRINFQDISSNQLTINLTVIGENLETTEQISSYSTLTASVLRSPITDYFIESLTILMISILIAIWAAAGIYTYRLKRKIETPPSKRKKKAKRKGKYVKPSEVPKEEKKKGKKEKRTDLDSLLEEEGI